MPAIATNSGRFRAAQAGGFAAKFTFEQGAATMPAAANCGIVHYVALPVFLRVMADFPNILTRLKALF